MLKFIPLEFETMGMRINAKQKDGSLKFIPLEFET